MKDIVPGKILLDLKADVEALILHRDQDKMVTLCRADYTIIYNPHPKIKFLRIEFDKKTFSRVKSLLKGAQVSFIKVISKSEKILQTVLLQITDEEKGIAEASFNISRVLGSYIRFEINFESN